MPIVIDSLEEEKEPWYKRDLGWKGWLLIPVLLPTAYLAAQVLQRILWL